MNEPRAVRPDSTLMFREASEAPAVVERQLSANDDMMRELGNTLRRQAPRFVLVGGRGSSSHAGTFGRHAIETQLHRGTMPVALSVGSVYSGSLALEGALYLAISQSGRSPDLLRNAEAARAAGARVIALVNVEDSPLAALADQVIPLRAGPENSVAATKTYLATGAALMHLVAHWSEDTALLRALHELPEAMRRAFELDWSVMTTGLQEVDNLFVLGRGPGLGAACEMALKFKETCRVHAEACSGAEVQHGPAALIGEGCPVLATGQSDAALDGMLAGVREFRQRGARVFSAMPGDSGEDALPLVAAPHALLAPLLSVQAFYRAINALAVARGSDPDHPPHLAKVTETL